MIWEYIKSLPEGSLVADLWGMGMTLPEDLHPKAATDVRSRLEAVGWTDAGIRNAHHHLDADYMNYLDKSCNS